jgi:hypothetical protein
VLFGVVEPVELVPAAGVGLAPVLELGVVELVELVPAAGFGLAVVLELEFALSALDAGIFVPIPVGDSVPDVVAFARNAVICSRISRSSCVIDAICCSNRSVRAAKSLEPRSEFIMLRSPLFSVSPP